MNRQFKPELSIGEKVELLKSKGTFVGFIDAEDFILSLYLIGDQYVELFYSISESRVLAVQAVEDQKRLNLYKIPDREYGIAS
jgi:hypothetical protein